jgi:hypothetical protein
MKSFQQFITEADDLADKEGGGHGTGTTHRGGDKIGADRKKSASEKKRTKAIGGGKTAPAKDYKQRSDAGSQRPKGRASERQQQPTKERGSASLSPREQQRKARAERMAGKSGGKSKEELKKSADKLLAKKKKSVHPDYKPQKASGYTAHERRKITRAGRRLVKDIQKGKEKHISHYNPGI